MVASSGVLDFSMEAPLVELLAILEGTKLAKNLGITRVEIEFDSTQVVNLINQMSSSLNEVGYWSNEI